MVTIVTETEQVVKRDDECNDKSGNNGNDKINVNGYFSEDDLHVLEIKDPDNAHKCTSISGLCVNCDKNNACTFIRGFAVLLKDRFAKPIVDCELSIYSCDDYPGKNDDCVYCNYPKTKRIEVNACQ